MNKYNYAALFFFLIIFSGAASAITCSPAGQIEQICTETKQAPYNTTSPEILVQFYEKVNLTGAMLYRVGEFGTAYPTNVTQIKESYTPIEVENITANTFVPKGPVADGTYMFRVDATNLPQNRRNVSVLFSINTSGMKFWVSRPLNGLISETEKPNFAVSTSPNFTLELTAERPVELCKYTPLEITQADLQTAFDIMPYSFRTDTSEYGQSLKFNALFNMSQMYPFYQEGKTYYPLSIICREPNKRYSFGAIYIGYDNSSPVITPAASPNPVKDASTASTKLAIKTSERAACTIKKMPTAQEQDALLNGRPIILRTESYNFAKADEFVTDYSEDLVYSGNLVNHTYNYAINCTNLAGLSSAVNYSVKVELTTVQQFIFSSPGDYVNGSSFIVNGTATIGALNTCSASMNKSGPFTPLKQETEHVGNVYSATLTPANFAEGRKTVYVNCTGMQDYFSEKTFTVDRTGPSVPNITTGGNSCSLDEITASIKSTDNVSGIKKYYYNFTLDKFDESIERSSTSGQISYTIDGELVEGETYILKAWAEDKAGNKGGVQTKNIKVTNTSIVDCDEIPPKIIVLEARNNQTNAWSIKVNCSDLESGCKGTFNYGIETNSSKKCNASDSSNLLSPIALPSSAAFCAVVYDNNKNERWFEKSYIVSYPLTCANGKKDGKETDIDCGGDCQKCQINKTCSINTDCSANYCNAKKCALPSCTDKVKNGNESAIDCGGNCNGCLAGMACTSDKDCKSSNCVEGRCADASCTDKKKDGQESDVDCGGNCTACLRGDACNLLTDCATKYCDSTTKSCEINPSLDSDSDGLTDVWEEQYCGSFKGCDPKGDLDGDKYSNLEEFIEGTNPLDKESIPDYHKYSIPSIILLILGALLIIGGIVVKVMEIMQEQTEEKAHEEAEMRNTLGQIPKMNSVAPEVIPVRELTDEEKLRGQQARLRALKNRDSQRRKVIDQFSMDDKAGESLHNENREAIPLFVPAKKEEPIRAVQQADSKKQEEYVDLSDIKKQKKSEDVFSKLKEISNSKQNTAQAMNAVPAPKKNISQKNQAPPEEVFEKLQKITKAKKTKI